jgi:hypothetical protein
MNSSAELDSPDNVCSIEGSESGRVLIVVDVDVFLEAKDLCVADVGPIDKRAEKE